ncbi:unnamed protein product [Allacma fusca]|uniref:Uncharacterized protein n=1 Tax=Allacma fusca TaxID=39272 RepID=A0A8J2JCM0_9HEXA|nr:unnamed protein product [Allacma fusca]
MDNNYYTGATLIRGSHHHHHNTNHGHYSPSLPSNGGAGGNGNSMAGPNNGTSLTGPPLLMQPRNNKNLFSGAPLIRNGSLNNGTVVSVPSNTVPTQLHSPTQPGVICCFQPVYYVPMMQNPGMHGPQLALPPPPIKKLNQPVMPKRRNYKSLQISKSNSGVPPSVTTTSPSTTPVISSAPAVLPSNPNLMHSKPLVVPAAISSSASAMPPNSGTVPSSVPVLPSSLAKTTRYLQSQSLISTSVISTPIKSTFTSLTALERNSSSPVDHMLFSHNGEENELNFQSVIESTRYLISNEEKQRSDKLLNFYFYDEHWRPRESEPTLSSSSQLNSSPTPTSAGMNYGTNFTNRRMSCQEIENDWISHIQHQNQLNNDTPHGFSNDYNNYCRPNSNSPLEVDETTLRIRQGQSLSEPKSNNNSGVSASAMVIKKKDLEVEAQIVTLANGHRDLEIHLCYVTS